MKSSLGIGQTGIPIVDAGMRELKQTGWMYTRVRMVVAQFLTKICYVIGALVKLTLCDIWWILTSGPIMVVA